MGIYPPINILNSASRVMNDIISSQHKQLVIKFKKLYALYKENEVLIRIGAYQKGVDKDLDEAVQKMPKMKKFLLQEPNEKFKFEDIIKILKEVIE